MQTEFTCEQCLAQLPEFLDDAVNTLQRQLIDQHLLQCETCNASLLQLWEVESLASRWREEAVPRWSRRQTFFAARNLWPQIHMVSTFATLLVLVLVLSGANISTKNGLEISFAGETYLTRQEFDKRVSLVQSDLQTQQRDQLQTRVTDFIASSRGEE